MAITNPQQIFTRLVLAKHSPQNGCYAADGDVLYVEPRKSTPQKTVLQHAFTSTADGRTKSKYGWIKDVPAFSLDDFVRLYLGNRELTPVEAEHIRIMLESVQSLPDGTPVTADYKSRGVIEQSMQLSVHKVIFYKE